MEVSKLYSRYRAAAEEARGLLSHQKALAGDDAMGLEAPVTEAFELQYALERQIMETPATTLAGVRVKLVVALENAREAAPNGELDADWQGVASAAEDLTRLSVEEGKPPAPGFLGRWSVSRLLSFVLCMCVATWAGVPVAVTAATAPFAAALPWDLVSSMIEPLGMPWRSNVGPEDLDPATLVAPASFQK